MKHDATGTPHARHPRPARSARSVLRWLFLVTFVVTGAFLTAAGCGSDKGRDTFPDDAGDDGASFEAGVFGDAGNCDLKCRQVQCDGGKKTTVSGTVFDPAGHLPLYNVIVFVPTENLLPIQHGATCDKCGAVASGSPLVATLTDAKGKFVLEDVPAGKDVPIVIQVGKWRRAITLPNVEPCQDNPITNEDLTRLPRKQSEGDLPQIAMVTGCDAMECLLRNMGIDDSEFTNPDGPGRVHMYQAIQGGKINDATPNATTFWGDANQLKKYDMVVLACECNVYPDEKPPEARAAMRDYINSGGRLFASHYHYFWLRDGGADLASTAEWQPDNQNFGGSDYTVDQSFPKGAALADWLVTVGASEKKGIVSFGGTPIDVKNVNAGASQRWIYDPDDAGPWTKYLTFNTPVGVAPDSQCGRVVFTDLHVSANTSGQVFPTGCDQPELNISEKALEFLIYDLSACIQKDSDRPGAPH